MLTERYQVSDPSIDEAWVTLVNSAYTQDLSVQDGTGIPHMSGSGYGFKGTGTTPSATLCSIYKAWGLMIKGAPQVDPKLETFRYDLVNLGREVLAQVSCPVSKNFSNAIAAESLDAATVKSTGDLYQQVLGDVDALVKTDQAFLLGPWLKMARYFGENSTDCTQDVGFKVITDCPHFYEWNARSQLR